MARVQRLLKATVNSWHGLIAAAQTEAAFRQELALLIVGAPLAFLVTGQAGERFALIAVLVFLLVVELLNTAIEKLADCVSRDIDPAIKRVKDMGSAAVGLSLVAAGAVWIWVIAGHIVRLR